jgi:TonB family protein
MRVVIVALFAVATSASAQTVTPRRGLVTAPAVSDDTQAILQSLGHPVYARPTIITNPDWRRRPTTEEFMRFYPEGAARASVAGHVDLRCLVAASGHLTNCAVESEAPPGYGFGDAALGISQLMEFKPATRDGVPIDGGMVRIPVAFKLPPSLLAKLLGMKPK